VVQDDFGPAVPNMTFPMQSHDPRFKPSKEIVKDLMTPAFLHDVSAIRITPFGHGHRPPDAD